MQIVCGGVPDVQKIDFATFGGKNKSEKVGRRGNLGNVQRRSFFSVTPSLMMCIEIKFEGFKARLVRQENSGNWYVCSR